MFSSLRFQEKKTNSLQYYSIIKTWKNPGIILYARSRGFGNKMNTIFHTHANIYSKVFLDRLYFKLRNLIHQSYLTQEKGLLLVLASSMRRRAKLINNSTMIIYIYIYIYVLPKINLIEHQYCKKDFSPSIFPG